MVRIFRHYIPKALLLLGMIEAFILLSAIYFGPALRYGPDWGAAPAPLSVLPRAVLFLLVMFLIMTAFGLYQREPQEGMWGYFPRLGVSFVVGTAVMSALLYVLPGIDIGREALVTSVFLALAGTAAVRLCYIKIGTHIKVRRRVLVLGCGSRAGKVDALEKQGWPSFRVVGHLALDEVSQVGDMRVLSDQGSLAHIVKKYAVQTIVVGTRDRRGSVPMREILQCKLAGIEVLELPAFLERETGRIELDTICPSWLVFSDGFRQGRARRVLKRSFDLLISVAVLALASPAMLLTALLVAMEDGRPIFYRQERVGQNGNKFWLYKFRSMRRDAEGDGVPKWAQKDDDRATRFGRVIRKLRLDELPQIWNVLRGDMSFVGPRPERPFFVSQLEERVAYYGYRHALKPGITGWAQVRYCYGASVEDAIQKLQYDFYYIKNNTLFLDMVVMAQTLQVLLWGKGR